MVVSGPDDVQLYTGTTGPGTITFAPVGPEQPHYNAIGVDPTSRIMYGISGTGAQNLVEVNPDGSVIDRGDVAGLPSRSVTFNAGAFGPDGDYYVGSSSLFPLYRIDVGTNRVVETLRLSRPLPGPDVVFQGGYLWGASPAGDVFRVDPDTGTVDVFPGEIPAASSYGGMFAYGNGDLGFVSNDGTVVRVQITDPTVATPSFTVLSTQSSPTGFVNLDATSCFAMEADLGITKTGPATVADGGQVAYTLTVTNNGPADSSGYTVTDTIPAGLTNAATTTPGCSITGGMLSCTSGALEEGASNTITLTGTAAPEASSIENTAEVRGNDADPNPDNNEDSVTTTVAPSVDLALTKSGPANVIAGESVSYTITVTNEGPSASTGWTVEDAVPAGLTGATSTTSGCTVTATLLTCTGEALAAGASTTITLTGKAAANAERIVNTATVTGDDPDPDPDNNGDSVTTTVTPSVDLAVTKMGPSEVTAGDTVSYTLTVTNNGPSDSSGWTLTDPVPAGLTGAATTTPGCSITGGTLTCTGDALSVDDSTTVVLTGTADAVAATITNTATVDGDDPDPTPDNDKDTVTTTVNPQPVPETDLAVTKAGPESASPGDTVTYTLTVTNNGPDPSTGWTLTDQIPAGLNGAATPTPGCSISGGTLTCTGGALAVGASTTITLTGTAAANVTRIVNTATVESEESDPDTGNNRDSATTTVAPSVDLALTKSGPATVSAGESVSYTITVTNEGPSASTGWTVEDAVPAGLTGATSTTSGCTVTATLLTCTGEALAVGASTTITLTGKAAANAERIVNTATVTGDDPDPDPDNNEDSVTTTVTLVEPAEADLRVTKEGPASVGPGARISYTITVTNNGPGDSSGWTLTDTVPTRIQNPSTNSDGCGIRSGRLTCTGGTLPVGESVSVTLTGTVAADATGDLVNTARITGEEPDPDPDNNEDTTTTTIEGKPGLTLTKKQNGPATVRPGDNVGYTITVTNTGTTAYTDRNPASFTDNLSEVLDDARYNDDAEATRGTVTWDDPVLGWSGALASGQSATITFTITTDARPFGDLKLLNTAVSETPGSNCRPDSGDSRCTTKGKVDARDKDKKAMPTA
ncbi:DUF6923 family protein [Streptomyces uncialis]|uniref:DUF6923 family protein n=1 Tax=Streptomyces uncialis TaxID=1048205 RepID=UPI003812AC00